MTLRLRKFFLVGPSEKSRGQIKHLAKSKSVRLWTCTLFPSQSPCREQDLRQICRTRGWTRDLRADLLSAAHVNETASGHGMAYTMICGEPVLDRVLGTLILPDLRDPTLTQKQLRDFHASKNSAEGAKQP